MKRLTIIAGLCLLGSQARAQVNTAPIAVGSGEKGIQSYRSQGYESTTTQLNTTTEKETTESFDPIQFIYDAQLKVIVHRENGDEQEAIALEKRITQIKKEYNLK